MWLQSFLIRLGPDLEEVALVVEIPIIFRVADARASAGELDFAALEILQVPHAVLVLECSIDNVGKDEEFGMGMRAKTCAGLDSILVDHTKGSPALVFSIIVGGERKRVVRVQPVMVSVTAL